MKRRSFLAALGLAPFVPFLAKLKPEQLPESWPEYRGQTWKSPEDMPLVKWKEPTVYVSDLGEVDLRDAVYVEAPLSVNAKTLPHYLIDTDMWFYGGSGVLTHTPVNMTFWH